MTDANVIAWFAPGQEPASSAPSLVGGKGARLIEMHRADLPVPPGFCLTTEAYQAATEPVTARTVKLALAGDSAGARALIRDAALPDEFASAVADAYALLGSPPVAVRSSATAEDLAEASFAGQQDTYLAVQGISEVLDSVRRCWASLWTDRAVAYREQVGVDHASARLAVVIQMLVDADVAGVLFTADPITGDERTTLVNASYGLGESVVSALVTPDSFVLDGNSGVRSTVTGTKETRIDRSKAGGTRTSPADPAARNALCIGPEELCDLARLSRQVVALYGVPQDIEWAFAGGRLYLLQSRPITTPGGGVSSHGAVKGRAARAIRDDLIEHYPAPYPLDIAAVRAVQGQVHGVMRMLGLKPPSLSTTLHVDGNGVVTVNATVPGVAPRLLRDLPRVARRAVTAAKDWDVEGPRWNERIARIDTASRRVSGQSDARLLELLDDSILVAADLTRERFLYYLAPMMIHRLAASFGIWVARVGSQVTSEDLLANLNTVTADVARVIVNLQAEAVRSGLGLDLHNADDPRLAVSRLPGGPDFLKHFDDALSRIGARTSRMYLPFSSQSWQERPDVLLRLVGGGVGNNHVLPKPQEDARERVRSRLPRPMRAGWDRRVAKLRRAHVGREATVYAIEQAFVISRRLMAEVAARLVQREIILEPSDTKFLLLEEVRDALLAEKPSSLVAVVARRQRMRGQAEAIRWDRGTAGPTGRRTSANYVAYPAAPAEPWGRYAS